MLIVNIMYDHALRMRSYEIIAEEFQLGENVKTLAESNLVH
jgi:hypothetical protein